MTGQERQTEWGVRRGGMVERISDAAAAEGYMSAEQAARVRAEASGGTVVTRTTTIVTSEWTPA